MLNFIITFHVLLDKIFHSSLIVTVHPLSKVVFFPSEKSLSFELELLSQNKFWKFLKYVIKDIKQKNEHTDCCASIDAEIQESEIHKA